MSESKITYLKTLSFWFILQFKALKVLKQVFFLILQKIYPSTLVIVNKGVISA